jgi:hypothetical protein
VVHQVLTDPTREITRGAFFAPTWMICETSRLKENPSLERTEMEDSFSS